MKVGCVVGLLVLVATASANAGIVGTPYANSITDAASAVCVWEPSTGTLMLQEVMYRSPAYVQGGAETDVVGDPTILIAKYITNSTGDTWTGYHFNIYMDQPFSIDSALMPTGWDYAITPGSVGSFFDMDGRPWAAWGAVDYVATAPQYYIPSNNVPPVLFGASVSFLQSVQFEVEQEGIVPEPVSLALLALGGLFLRRCRS
jgi:hypothetical protein